MSTEFDFLKNELTTGFFVLKLCENKGEKQGFRRGTMEKEQLQKSRKRAMENGSGRTSGADLP